MTLQKPHQLICHTLRWSELSLIDAIFLHRADGSCSFPHTLLNSRGEERFTHILRGALHQSLHRSMGTNARQIKPIEAPKSVGLHAAWNPGMAGATPPFDAPCVTDFVGRSRLCHALGGATRLGRVHTQGQAVSNADSNTIG